MSSKTSKIDNDLPADLNIPDNYVEHTLKTTKALPPFSWKNISGELNYLNVVILILTPIIGIISVYFTKLRWETFLFAVLYYYITGFGITAGYH